MTGITTLRTGVAHRTRVLACCVGACLWKWALVVLASAMFVPVHAEHKTLRVHTSNTASETGILQALADDFQKQHPDIQVVFSSAGSLQVLDSAREGGADLIITHLPQGEALLMTEGYGLRHASFMYNEFAILGPREDPLKLNGERDLIKALRLLARQQVNFVAPGTHSGTASRLNELWALASIRPHWPGYVTQENRAGAVLEQAAQSGAYSFADLGTYYKNRDKLPKGYVPLFRDHTLLRNTYSATVIDPGKVPDVNAEAANIFLEYLVSNDGQTLIRRFSEERFGASIFTPSAHLDGTLRDERAKRDLEEGRQAVATLTFLVMVLVVVGGTAGVLAWRLREMELGRQQAMAEKLAAEIANKAKSDFLANMSHEIRTPLTAIIGFAESLPDTRVPAVERLAAVQSIAQNGHYLLQLINNILDMAKIESDRLEVERIEVAPAGLVEEVRALVEPQARAKGLDFSVEYVFPLPATISSDPVRIKQILLNLCNNAIKFTPQGGLQLRVACDPDAERISFSVQDSGIGLTPEQLTRLFEPFSQADSTTTRRFGGSGLGLHLSRRLAELLGGDISVTSEAGQGSRFTLTITTGALNNVEQVHELPVSKAPSVPTLPKYLRGRVLLAEDTPDNQRLIAMYVTRTGAELVIASNGQEAVTLTKYEPFDLILMDVQMPVMDGLQATRKLRANGYTGPIVMLTANALRENREECLAAGGTDFLTKPIDREALHAVLSAHLTPSEAPVSNQEPIASALLKENAALSGLIIKFVERLPQTLESLDAALRETNWVDLKRMAHDLKGLGGGYGYPYLSTLAAKLEFEVLKKDAVAVGDCLGELHEMATRIERGLQQSAPRHSGVAPAA